MEAGKISLKEFDPSGALASDIAAAEASELAGLRLRQRERVIANRISDKKRSEKAGKKAEEAAGFSAEEAGFKRVGSDAGTSVGVKPQRILSKGDKILRDQATRLGLKKEFIETASPTNLVRAVEEALAASTGELPLLIENRASLLGSSSTKQGSFVGAPSPSKVAQARAAFEADAAAARRQGASEVDIKGLKTGVANEFDLFVDEFASGGKIRGFGGPRQDNIPILASNGEFMINAGSAKRLGLASLEFMNKTGQIPSGVQRFQDGGVVGIPSGGGATSVNIEVDADLIAGTISAAVAEALQGVISEGLSINGDEAAISISNAIGNAIGGIQIDVTAPASIPLDTSGIPASITLDTAGLDLSSLGGNLGAAVRDLTPRVEAIEGSVASLQEDQTDIKTQATRDFDISSEETSSLGTVVTEFRQELSDRIDTVNETITGQPAQIIDEVNFIINEQLSNLDVRPILEAQLARLKADTNIELTRITSNVSEAIRTANQALSLANRVRP